MIPFRFLHAADLHLDTPFRGMTSLSPSVRRRVRESTFAALDALVDLAIREQVDFVLLGGDIYDLSDRSLRAQIRLQKAVERLDAYDISVYAVHGNHDPLDGRSARLAWPPSMHFYDSGEVSMLPVHNRKGEMLAAIYGISYATAATTENLALQFPAVSRSTYNIGLLHANVEGNPDHDRYAPCGLRDLLAQGMDYWALGHVHTREVLHREPWVVYPGNMQGRSVRETGAKGCYIVDVSAERASRLSFHALDSIRWAVRDIPIGDLHTEQDLRDSVEQQIEAVRGEAEGRAVIARISFVGRGPLHHVLRGGNELKEWLEEFHREETERLQDNAAAAFVWIESFQDRTGFPADVEQLLAEDSFIGDLLRISRELASDEGALKQFAAAAMEPLVRGKLARYIPDLMPEDMIGILRDAEETAIGYLLAGEERQR